MRVSQRTSFRRVRSLGLTVDLASINRLGDDTGRLAVDLASHAVRGTENFFDRALKVLGERLVAHGASDLDNLVKSDRLVVLDILLLLAVTRRLLKSLDDQGGGSGDDRDGSLTVLDGELDSYAQAFLHETLDAC